MISADTNILVRAFLFDDKEQSTKAKNFILRATKNNDLFISSYALLEFVWVLKTKKFTREEIYDAVVTLVDAGGITIGQREIVLDALEKYGKGKADFGDYMIISEGERKGSHRLKTFDQKILGECSSASMP